MDPGCPYDRRQCRASIARVRMSLPPAELVNPAVRRGPFRAVLFDFDGTLSLIREGWPRVMVGMMVERLATMGLVREPEAVLRVHLDRLVMAQNGRRPSGRWRSSRPMCRCRGGTPADPRSTSATISSG